MEFILLVIHTLKMTAQKLFKADLMRSTLCGCIIFIGIIILYPKGLSSRYDDYGLSTVAYLIIVSSINIFRIRMIGRRTGIHASFRTGIIHRAQAEGEIFLSIPILKFLRSM